MIGGKRFGEDTEKVGGGKKIPAELLNSTGGDSLSPVGFPQVVAQLGGTAVNVSLAVGGDAARQLTVRQDGEGKKLLRVGGQHRGQKGFPVLFGVGIGKAKYLETRFNPATIELMKRVKNAFDPHGIMNPGKIFAKSNRRRVVVSHVCGCERANEIR